jgi:hypothetical protein
MNTRVAYLYDASGYKKWSADDFGDIVLAGTLTDSEIAEIRSIMDGSEFFIASEVGLPDLQQQIAGAGDWDDSIDHAFSMAGDDFLADTAGAATTTTVTRTVADLLTRFRAVGNWQNWDVQAAYVRFGVEQVLDPADAVDFERRMKSVAKDPSRFDGLAQFLIDGPERAAEQGR